jgi:hypothetical protein
MKSVADNSTVYYSQNEFVRGNFHINGIESFWGYAKTRLIKSKDMEKRCLIYT